MIPTQSRRSFVKTVALTTLGIAVSCKKFPEFNSPPNFVIIFLDDSGWSDFGPFGNTEFPTPNVDRLASEGCSFHNFYVPQAVCSASRAALLTGCYPGRTKVFNAHPPGDRGLDPKFATLGEVLKKERYKTAVFGKWHIGDQPETRPDARGFDESCGLMYSNDMWRFHPESPDYWGQWPLRYWENGEVVIEDVTPEDQKTLTRRYTEHAVDFIGRNRKNPFLLYVPHSMPHVPLFCSDEFDGKTGKGVYADVISEIDWSVGEILNSLKSNGLEENTVVILTSDNGPWMSYGNHAGKTPFRESKATSFDGGIRSACIMKYPGHIKAGTISEKAFSSIDIVPTICGLAGAKLPDNPIDGKNVWPLIQGKPLAENPHEYYAFSTGRNMEGVISGDGRWKLHLPHNYRKLVKSGMNGEAGKYETRKIELSLFDMKNDPYETVNVIEQYPDVFKRLKEQADKHLKMFYSMK